MCSFLLSCSCTLGETLLGSPSSPHVGRGGTSLNLSSVTLCGIRLGTATCASTARSTCLSLARMARANSSPGSVSDLLVAEGEEAAEVYGLALDRDQAGYVFRAAARMVELSPTLAKRIEVLRSAGRLVDPSTASFLTTAAGDAAGVSGSSPHGAYIDELLTQPSCDVYDALRTGMGTRAQPLLMMATTAENDPHGFAAQERAWSERVAQDPKLDPTRLVRDVLCATRRRLAGRADLASGQPCARELP